jgi:23S rRNA (uracil1939-C5)-methyltransferase
LQDSSVVVRVTVHSLGGLGDGIATHNGKPLFIQKSCAGDVLDVKITHETKEKYQGDIVTVVSAGIARQTAPCPYFDRCGGCTLQQLSPEHYRAFKTRILHSSLANAGFPSPGAEVLFLPERTRRRVEFKTHYTEGKLSLAFFSLRSHTPVIVSQCMVLHPTLESLIKPLGEMLSELPSVAHLYSVSITLADHGVDAVLTFKNIDIQTIRSMDELARALGLARISICTPDSAPKIISQIASVAMQLGDYKTPFPPAAFLQATQEGQSILTKTVLEVAANKSSVVDLFCGIGTYSFPLSSMVKTHAVEGDNAMIEAMHTAITQHKLHRLTAEKRDLFKRPLTASELARFDTAIINPPRLGAKAQTLEIAQSSIKHVVMISCNPATFTRDAANLKNAGFILKSAMAIDQFIWSQHLEVVAVFERE